MKLRLTFHQGTPNQYTLDYTSVDLLEQTFDEPEAKGEIKLTPNGYGLNVDIDGHEACQLDLYNRSIDNQDANQVILDPGNGGDTLGKLVVYPGLNRLHLSPDIASLGETEHHEAVYASEQAPIVPAKEQ